MRTSLRTRRSPRRLTILHGALLLIGALVLGATGTSARATDQLITGKKFLLKSNSADSAKNKIVFLSKDNSFDLPSGDPTVVGASLQILDNGAVPTGGAVTIALPSSRWSAVSGGFKFKGQSGDGCKTVVIKEHRLIKAVCKGSAVTLSAPFAGSAALGLTVGTTSRYCASFGGTNVRNELKPNGKGTVKRKDANAPVACFTCGNGALDGGEQCDDGNAANGDCCSSTCQFEISGTACNDGDACSSGDVCDGAGTCSGGSLCGNGTANPECGEQCDGGDDSICPGRCNDGDCTCLPAPSCDADPSRTFFAGGPESSACRQFDNNQLLCEQAFHLGGGGVSSCFYDIDSGDCRGCGPANQADGLCMNTCRPVTCVGDPSRTEFAGGPQSSACQEFGLAAGTANCELAFHIGSGGVASCYYDADQDECRGCGASNQADGACVNDCAACQADPARTIFLGGPRTSACHEFDGNQVDCEQSFHRDECGNDVSCYYDGVACNGCGPNNESEGNCQNTCRNGPLTCTNDPSRTVDAGGPGTGACHQFDGDPSACQQAFHRNDCSQPTSCYYDFDFDICNGCGTNNEQDGRCVNTCVAGPVLCTADLSRTLFAGMPGSNACANLGVSAGTAACESAFHIGASGVASCFLDDDECSGCGVGNESNGRCRNTCTHGAPTCPDDPSRTVFAGGPQTSACGQFGDQASCESAFHLGQCGNVASCFWDGTCRGCGPNNESGGDCVNTCGGRTCDGDPSRTIFAGGPNTSACHFFDGNQTLCESAFHFGNGGAASCYFDVDTDECSGCGPNNESNGDCVNTCPLCTNDLARAVFAGGPGTQACRQFDGDRMACEGAFHHDSCGNPTSCFYDSSDSCRGCGPDNAASLDCRNTCVLGPPTCARDAARTIYAGGPQTAACQQYDGDPASCMRAFHLGSQGIASCYYDQGSGNCKGCGPNNESSGECANTCLHGAPPCSEDPSRILAGVPNTAACHAFDGDPIGCAGAYHLDQCRNAASCFYDSDSESCMGCGPSNEQGASCVNTCRTGPASCDLDPSRTLFGGGPQTNACDQYLTASTCLAAFHLGQCGVASCYWDGSCRGCGPNNELGGNCFNTCQAP